MGAELNKLSRQSQSGVRPSGQLAEFLMNRLPANNPSTLVPFLITFPP